MCDVDFSCTPPDVAEMAKEISLNLLPSKSREVYECAYKRFMRWCQEKKVKSYSENVLLAYFAVLSASMKSSTLWSQYSMVRATLNIKNGVDIGTFTKLRAYLKCQNEGYTPKKSRVLTKEQVDQFLNYAPDDKFLMMKVALILGVAGACRCDELIHLKTDDVEECKSALLVKILKTKTKKSRSFTVMGEKYINIYRKYVALRPNNFAESRLFIKYQNGKCYRSVVGIHKISAVAQEVAKYLKLENANEYTGHSLRRTSATLLVDSGADITCLKRHGGWKSNSVAEGYIEDSLENKKDIATKILRLEKPCTSSSIDHIIHHENETIQENEEVVAQSRLSPQNPSTAVTFNEFEIINNSTNTGVRFGAGAINFQSCTNCTFNINIKQ